MGFKKDFIWGGATASYQVEGAAYEDGKGLNIWDIFCKDGGHIYENQTGDAACDQYHRYKEDVQIMKEMGMKAYRFSLSWARIMPEGTGTVNEKGLKYYDNLINELLDNGIEPFVTLYHWDLPYALHLQGGWMNPNSPSWFYEYAKVVAEHFSDRVKNFFTINEPQCIVGLGYQTGEHAPGLKVGPSDYFRIWHNVLKAHGRAVEALREFSKQPVKISMAPCGALYVPETNKPEDIEAARKANFSLPENSIGACSWDVALCCDPVYLGQYPEDILKEFGQFFPKVTDADMKLISQKLDEWQKAAKTEVSRELINSCVAQITPVSNEEFRWVLDFQLSEVKGINMTSCTMDGFMELARFVIPFEDAKAFKASRNQKIHRRDWTDLTVIVGIRSKIHP